MRICVALVALLACKGSDKPAQPREGSAAPPEPTEGGGDPWGSTADPGRCQQKPFAESTPLAEASGAAWLEIDGKLSLVVVADSGHYGDYVVLDPDTGVTREQGKFPLGTKRVELAGATFTPGDDIEGLAEHGGKVYGLTSDGWMRVWQRKGKGFELVDGPYAIGNEDDGTTCAPHTKCAINYEGLALATTPQNGCAGVACSKGHGDIYCLAETAGRYAIDPARRIPVTRENALADCAFDDKDVLWAGNNVFGMNQVFRIDNWGDHAKANVDSTNAFGVGFPEVIAARGDVIYRMSDTGGSPSLLSKFRCLAPTR